jgi:hypothetical protein
VSRLAPWALVDDDQDTNTAPGDGGTGAGASFGPGAEQFQRAALDAVRAARALLDAAEKVLADPAALDSVIRAAAGMARSATDTVAGFASAAAPSARGTDGPPDAPGEDRAEPEEPGGFESIRVD